LPDTVAVPEGRGWISKLLPAAVRFWLHTQAEHIENLVFEIQGRDRQILRGHLPQVVLSADKAIYQGMHLSRLRVEAREIRVNLGQILRGKPLRLLAPFPVEGRVGLSAADLNASLNSELLGTGLYDFLTQFAAAQTTQATQAGDLQAALAACPDKTVRTHYQAHATLDEGIVRLQLMPLPGQSLPTIAIETGLMIDSGRYLRLHQPHWISPSDPNHREALTDLQDFTLDLGPEVTLTECSLTPAQMVLGGHLRVLP
jgi:hypothetical protein